jgi:hypothetical protein
MGIVGVVGGIFKMIVMPTDNTGFECGYMAATYPGRIAHLHGCDVPKAPRHEIPWSLDNGVFGAWQEKREWSEEPLFRYLDKYAMFKPSWITCPDWVADRKLTLERWEQFSPALKAYGYPLAFVVQDGMDVCDVPVDADVVFVGGSTSWKWRSLKTWTKSFKRVHVGRVNSYGLLWQAHNAGAESCDGTGWFRGNYKQLNELRLYLMESTGVARFQHEFTLTNTEEGKK